MITAVELAQFRSESGLTQGGLAGLLNDILDRKYTNSIISLWESGRKTIPSHVQAAIEQLRDGQFPRDDTEPYQNGVNPVDEIISEVTDEEQPKSKRDIPPSRPSPTGIVVPAMSMEAMAIEMWLGIGQMVEFFAVATGQPKVMKVQGTNSQISLLEADGRIIAANSERLGKAWAKLAQQNAWVARIMNSMTSGGAWVEVVAATGTMMVEVYRNHAEYAAWVSGQDARNPEQTTEAPDEASTI